MLVVVFCFVLLLLSCASLQTHLKQEVVCGCIQLCRLIVNAMKEKGNVDIQINQCGLAGEILASITLSSYVIGLKGHISSTNRLPIM